MYDTTIHRKTLARHLRKADFAADRSIHDRVYLEQIIDRAVVIGASGFTTLSLTKNLLRKKAVYQITDLAECLVVRHITSNIKSITKVRQDDRQFIVRCMQMMLSEGTSFRVYRLDIASFYESVPVDQMLLQLETDIAFSGQSLRALRSLFIQLAAAGVQGLPRGMSISATLAEYLLRDFDKEVSGSACVRFYARFVDDIIIITHGREDVLSFQKFLRETLPQGLKFNRKSDDWSFDSFRKLGPRGVEHEFDFLGYKFSVGFASRTSSDNRIRRDVDLDIAASKVRKIKTRIAKSMLAYKQDRNFGLLFSRVKLLTSNFNFWDLKTDQKRTSGIFFNYPFVAAPQSAALPDLDKFLSTAILSAHPKNSLRPLITTSQRQQLLNLRFQDGFTKKRFFAFSPSQLKEIVSCWTYA